MGLPLSKIKIEIMLSVTYRKLSAASMAAALLSIEKSKIDPSPQVIANSAHFRNDTLNPSIAFT